MLNKVFIKWAFLVFATISLWIGCNDHLQVSHLVNENNTRDIFGFPILAKEWDCKKISNDYYFCSSGRRTGHLGKEIVFEDDEILFDRDFYRYQCGENETFLFTLTSNFLDSSQVLERTITVNGVSQTTTIEPYGRPYSVDPCR